MALLPTCRQQQQKSYCKAIQRQSGLAGPCALDSSQLTVSIIVVFVVMKRYWLLVRQLVRSKVVPVQPAARFSSSLSACGYDNHVSIATAADSMIGYFPLHSNCSVLTTRVGRLCLFLTYVRSLLL